MHVDAAIAFAGDRAGDIVANPERAMPFALALAQGGQGVGCFPALTDDKRERVALERDIAVTELAGEFAFNGNVRKRLDDVFARHGGMECRATACEHDTIHSAQLGVRHVEPAKLRRGLFEG